MAGPGPALAGAGLALCGFLGGTPKREIATDCARGRSQGPSVPGRARPRGCRGKDPAQVGVEETASRTRGGARRRRQALGRVSTEQVRTESGARIPVRASGTGLALAGSGLARIGSLGGTP